MKNVFYLLLLAVAIFLTNCTKKVLDFDSDHYYELEQVINSENCDTKCGKMADCEGEEVKIRALIDVFNVDEDRKVFFIKDVSSDYTMEVKVLDSIADDIFNGFIKNYKENEVIHIQGIINGFDAPTNFECKRLFYINLEKSENLTLE